MTRDGRKEQRGERTGKMYRIDVEKWWGGENRQRAKESESEREERERRGRTVFIL